MRTNSLMLLAVFAAGCTTMGPMPMSTMVSAVPVGRPGVELESGGAPGFYLSDAAQEHLGTVDGGPVRESHVLIEPDRLIGAKGLVIGARSFGDGSTVVEPMLGYRRKLDDMFSVLAIGYGGKASDGHKSGTDAYYRATRLGAEITADADLFQGAPLSLHLFVSINSTYENATGRYCVSGDGWGVDCDENSRRANASVDGVYTSGNAGVALDIARRPTGYLHDIRVFGMASYGVMPRLFDGNQEPSKQRIDSIGVGLQLGFGADK